MFPYKANECTRWAFMLKKPIDATIVFDEDGTTANVTCNVGYAFRRPVITDVSELIELTYTCIGGATQFTETAIGFGDYVPECVRKWV